MSQPYRIRLAEDFAKERGGILAGALFGQQVLGKLIGSAPRPATPTICYLDFEGVEVATASFVRECVVGFRDYARQRNANLYPVVANASTPVLEDLEIVLRAKGDAIAACHLDARGMASKAIVVGHLEPKQQQTLDGVRRLGEAEASALFKHFKDGKALASPTAWNNRLAGLVSRGLLVETPKGRGKSYRCVLQGLTYGPGLHP